MIKTIYNIIFKVFDIQNKKKAEQKSQITKKHKTIV